MKGCLDCYIYPVECRKQLVHWDYCWVINSTSTFPLSFICEIVILCEIRSGESVVRVSQVVNLMPLQGTATPFLGMELCCCYSTCRVRWGIHGFTGVERNNKGNSGYPVFLTPCLCPTLLGTGFSSAWVHRYKQGLTKQQLPHFNAGLGWQCPLGSARQWKILPFKEEAGPSWVPHAGWARWLLCPGHFLQWDEWGLPGF